MRVKQQLNLMGILMILMLVSSIGCERKLWLEGRALQDGGVDDGESTQDGDSDPSDDESSSEDDGEPCVGEDCPHTCVGEDCIIRVGEVITRPDGESHDTSHMSFGRTLAIYGDLLVVGAPTPEICFSTSGTEIAACGTSGSVYIYKHIDSRWSFIRELTPHDEAGRPILSDNGLMFGSSISVNDRWIIVGAKGDPNCNDSIVNSDLSCRNTGSVFIFEREGDDWVQTQYLNSFFGWPNEAFGTSVLLAHGHLFVGAPGDVKCTIDLEASDYDCDDAGSVYIFELAGTAWQAKTYLKGATIRTQHRFGETLAALDDGVAVGAPGDSNCATGVDSGTLNWNCEHAGSVEILELIGEEWTQTHYLKPNGAWIGDAFGGRLSARGNTLLISALGDDECHENWIEEVRSTTQESCAFSGAVYVFDKSAEWEQKAYLKSPGNESRGQFGAALWMGAEAFFVGAQGEAACFAEGGADCRQQGSVYLYHYDGSLPIYLNEIQPPAEGRFDGFGQTMVGTADTIFIAMSEYDSCAENAATEQARELCLSTLMISALEIDDG